MNYIAYLSYGSGRHQYEAAYAALIAGRFARLYPDARDGFSRIVITDTPSFFQRLGINVIKVTTEMIREWRGEHDFGHRCKIKALQLLFAEGATKAILVDGDTYFVRDPRKLLSRLAPGRSLMYEQESPLADARIADYILIGEELEKSSFYAGDGTQFQCGRRTMQWNAGVIGLSRDDAPLLDDVLAITDSLLSRFKLWSIEQTAFSIVLQQRTRLAGAYRSIYHYNASRERTEFGNRLQTLIDGHAGIEESWHLRAAPPVPARRIRAEMKRVFTATHLWDPAMRARRFLRSVLSAKAT
jgi:hypothetical protein